MATLLALLGFAGFVLSIIALIRPIARVGLGSRKRAALALVGSIILLGVAGSMMPAEGPGATAPANVAEVEAVVPTPIGQAIQVGDAAVTIEKVETRERVGIQYAMENASEGGVLVVVHRSIKNVGTKPLKAFEVPGVKLVDPAGVEYSPDIAKTGSYSMERGDLNAKIWSDLNPGITVRDAEVFEVSQESYDPNTWHVTFGGKKNRVAMVKPAS